MRRWLGPVYPEDDPREKRFAASIEKIRSILGKVVQRVMDDRRRAESGSGGDAGESPYLLVDTIIDSARDFDDPSMPSKEEVIISDAITFFVGGFHTTSNRNSHHAIFRFELILNDLPHLFLSFFIGTNSLTPRDQPWTIDVKTEKQLES